MDFDWYLVCLLSVCQHHPQYEVVRRHTISLRVCNYCQHVGVDHSVVQNARACPPEALD